MQYPNQTISVKFGYELVSLIWKIINLTTWNTILSTWNTILEKVVEFRPLILPHVIITLIAFSLY